MRSFILFYLFYNVIFITNGQGVYNLKTKYPVHDLSSNLRIYKDVDHNYSKEDILLNKKDIFLLGNDEPIHMENGPIYWGRIDIRTEGDLDGWTLQFEDRKIGLPAWTKGNGKVDVFGYIDSRLIFHKKTGVEYSKSERDIANKWVLDQISLEDLPINENVTLIIKSQGNQMGYAPYFNLTARSPEQPFYHEIYNFRNSFNIFMFGVTFIIFLYHYLQYVYQREKVFFWFSVWLFFCFLTQGMSIGLILGSFTEFRFEIWALIANGIFYSFWFFGRSFIDSKTKYPVLDKLMKYLAVFLRAEILVIVSGIAIFDFETQQTGVGIHYYILNLYTVVSFIVSILLILKKDLFARYFGIGSLVGCSLFLIGSLWSLGIIKPIKFFDPFSTGILLQIIIYSFGISYRQQVLKRRNSDAQSKARETQLEIQRIKDLDEVKSRFFSNISHEFRTPLSMISGPLELSKELHRGKDGQITISNKVFNSIIRNADRLQNLIDQLLELSKIESGQVFLNLSKGNLVNFVKTLTFSFESMAERKNISLNTSFPKEIKDSYYDKDKLEKILSNLLSNAFKYSHEGGTVTLTMENNDSHFTIEVSDTGDGMAKDDVIHIFDRFYRVEGTEQAGSGIGLALTKEMVDLHKGTINVNSRIGEGTSFKVRLPYKIEFFPNSVVFSKDADRQVDYSESTIDDFIGENKSEENHIDEKKPMVLVVEDNADLLDFIFNILKNDYHILRASNGLQGERMAFEHVPDILVSDVMMPKKDGYQLCFDLKSNPKTSHIPLIMLTAKAGHDNKIEGLTQGADAYLTKPFSPDELRLLVRNLIESRKKLWDHFKTMDFTTIEDIEVVSIDDKFLRQVTATITKNLDNEELSVSELAREVGFSPAQLHRKLKALTNKSANQLIVEIRLNKAKYMLENNLGSVSEVAYSVGYSNLSYFSRTFKEKFGTSPSKL